MAHLKKKEINRQHFSQRFVNLSQSGEISPNLVTLLLFFLLVPLAFQNIL